MLRVDLPTSTPTLRMDVDIVECRFLSCPVSEQPFMESAMAKRALSGSLDYPLMLQMAGIPDFRAIRSSLQVLQLDNSRLTQLRETTQASKAAAEHPHRQQFHRPRANDVFQLRTCSPYPHIYILFCSQTLLHRLIFYLLFPLYQLCK
ncbi:hypothetical protein CEXT_252341 [Caerostris extrusa]|uniref:Uncharacterized protein n=1 Tax=Caerostris extrusa TaxID=172846 RepID=A0AAV4QGW5_CAEEX|nr:hypothetical protein CEXT_252341 [Caerostris extrusa]